MTILHTRVVCGVGGGPDKTILNSPRFVEPHGFRMLCAYMHPIGDGEFEKLRDRARECEATLIGVPDRGAWDVRVARRLLRLCREERVTVWHGHDYKSNALGLLLRRFHPMRLVTTVHGWGVTGGRRSLYYAIDRQCLKFYERVICVSADLQELCLAAGVRRERCRLVENAIDLEQFTRRRTVAEAKMRLGLPPERLLVGAVGRLSEEKGFDRLIEAVSRLRKGVRSLLPERPDGCCAQKAPDTFSDAGKMYLSPFLDLVILGEGPQRGTLERLIAQRGLQGRVRLVGYQAETIEWFEAMDIFALSSLREGLPNVLLEAMALEVPVVATRIAGVPRLVNDGENGLLVEPDDIDGLCQAIGTLADQPALRQQFAAAGRKTIEAGYSFAMRMEKIRKIYDEILGLRS